jgi:hypothetical protein
MMARISLIIPLMFCIFNISLHPLRTFSTVLVSVPSLGCRGGFLGTADSKHEGSCLRDRENLKDGVAPKSQDSEGRRLFHNSQVHLDTTRLTSAQTSIRSGCIWRNLRGVQCLLCQGFITFLRSLSFFSVDFLQLRIAQGSFQYLARKQCKTREQTLSLIKRHKLTEKKSLKAIENNLSLWVQALFQGSLSATMRGYCDPF